MGANLKILDSFINEYNQTYTKEEIVYDENLLGDIKKVKDKLLDEKFLPSQNLKRALDKQLRRAQGAMEVAITGQFSAGKSTFLNALLSKNILPTGITPVTSKVNFIQYGEEYKLKINYYSGAQEYAQIESIANFTDQRSEQLKDIKYLTLYAPLDILKDITFVDTPGLNSQSQSDTDTTRNVLKDVGGIIWLTLIDNAGKQSEAKILEEYMQNFKDKTICVLNQKDKFTQEQIQTTKDYVSEKFSKFFTQVTPISAKMALDSRAKQKDILVQDNIDLILKEFKDDLKNNLDSKNLDFFEKKYANFQNILKEINSTNTSKNEKLLKESNIQEVLDFIENQMRPKAAQAKEYAIKNDLKNFCDILISEYQTIIKVFDALSFILKNCESTIIKNFEEIHKKYSKQLFTVHNSLESIMEKIAQETHKNIQVKKAFRFEESQKGFLKSDKIEKIEYETYWINADNVYKNLFYDDQTIDKMLKKSIKLLKNIKTQTNEAFLETYETLENEVKKWQEPYELLKKHREIASDLEFSNTRHFAAKVYENILKDYHTAILANISAFKEKFAYFNGAISYSYIQITQATIAHFEQQILESEELYKKEPTRFSIQYPSVENILSKLKTNFGFEKIEDFLTSRRNYLFKIIEHSKEQYLEINEDRINFIESKKAIFLERIDDLEKIKEEI